MFNRARLQGDGLSSLLFTHIERKNDRLVPRLLESCHAEQYWHACTIFAEKLLLERLQVSDPSYPFNPPFVGGVPLWWCEVRPTQTARNDIPSVVSQHAKICVIGLKDRTSEIHDVNTDDVGIDQAPDLRLTFLKIAVGTRGFESARCQRRNQLQYRDSCRREDTGCQVVFKDEDADKF